MTLAVGKHRKDLVILHRLPEIRGGQKRVHVQGRETILLPSGFVARDHERQLQGPVAGPFAFRAGRASRHDADGVGAEFEPASNDVREPQDEVKLR